MKKLLAMAVLAMGLGSMGCTTYSAIATAPDGKVFVTKTTSYIIWAVNKMEVCDYSNNKASNCSEVTQD